MSLSRVGDRRSDDKRLRNSRVHSALRASSDGVDGLGMFASRDAFHGFNECIPRLLLFREHAAALGRQLIEPAATFAGFLHPAALDPFTLLEAIEERIERIDVESQGATRPGLDQLAQVVAM